MQNVDRLSGMRRQMTRITIQFKKIKYTENQKQKTEQSAKVTVKELIHPPAKLSNFLFHVPFSSIYVIPLSTTV